MSLRPAHLLVRLPNPIGDAVMSTPALEALRQALPETRITWAGRRGAHAVLAGLSALRDGVVPLAGAMATGSRAPFRAGRFLRTLGCDAALLLPNSWSSALEVQRARIPVRVGSTLTRRGALLTHPVALPRTDAGALAPRSMVSHYLALAAPFGVDPEARNAPRLRATAFDEERAMRRLAEVPADLPLVAVNPGAAFGPSKIYPPEAAAEALALAHARRPIALLVLCGPGEEAQAAALARAYAERSSGPCLSTDGDPPDLGELKALLRRSDLLATSDAGPRHIAEAFAVPTVVWMGPTDPRWSAHSQATVLRVEGLSCLACHESLCPIDHPCMRELDPLRVAQAILDRLPPA
jgi:heptosyltransferase-2